MEVWGNKPSEHVVLVSGGIDSATLLALLAGEGARVSALHIDYGQPARGREREASAAIAAHYAAPYRRLMIAGLTPKVGEICGRNALLMHAALTACVDGAKVIGLAIHDRTPYRDCRREFVELMQASFDFHTGGAVTIAAPFVTWPKSDVHRLAIELDVPLELTHSCEAGDEPCLVCLSCLDREALGARTV